MRLEKVKLKDVANWGSGGTPSRKQKAYFSGDIIWFKTGEAGPKYIWDSEEKITSKALSESSAKLYPAGSVVVAMYAGSTIGNCSILGVEAATNQAFAVAVCNQNRILNEYLYYFIMSQRGYLQNAAFGGTQDNLTLEKIQNWEILLPSCLDDQRAVVAFIDQHFEKIDTGTSNLVDAERQLELYRQSVLKDAFEGKLTADWRAANPDKVEPADKLLARIEAERKAAHQAELDSWAEAVKHWEAGGRKGKKPAKPKFFQSETEVIVSNPIMLSLKLGLVILEPKYGTSKKCSYDSGQIPVLRIPNLAQGKIDARDLKYADFTKDELDNYKLEDGDLLIIRSNGSVSLVGKTCIISEHEEGYLFAGYLIRLKPIRSIINSQYLKYMLGSLALRKQIVEKAKSTSGVNNLNAKEIQNLTINLVSMPEQQRIVDILNQNELHHYNQLVLLSELKQKADALKQSILKQAFSGDDLQEDAS